LEESNHHLGQVHTMKETRLMAWENMFFQNEKVMEEDFFQRHLVIFTGKTRVLLLGLGATLKLLNLAIMGIVHTIRHWRNDDTYWIIHFHFHFRGKLKMTPHLFS
jgi:hypothetical protein